MGTILLLLGATWFLVTVALYHREQRLVWPYGPLCQTLEFSDNGGYARRTVEDALREDFSLLGWAAHSKGGLYRVTYAFVVSPERDTVAIIGVGAIMRIPVAGTIMCSCTTGGRLLYSTDDQGLVEIDLCGLWRGQLAPKAPFGDLWNRHRQLVLQTAFIPIRFPLGQELEVLRAARAERFRLMFRERFLTFLDNDETYWRYTLWGALKLTVVGYAVGVLRGLTKGRIPRYV